MNLMISPLFGASCLACTRRAGRQRRTRTYRRQRRSQIQPPRVPGLSSIPIPSWQQVQNWPRPHRRSARRLSALPCGGTTVAESILGMLVAYPSCRCRIGMSQLPVLASLQRRWRVLAKISTRLSPWRTYNIIKSRIKLKTDDVPTLSNRMEEAQHRPGECDWAGRCNVMEYVLSGQLKFAPYELAEASVLPLVQSL